MAARKAIPLRRVTAAWNFGLAVFSFIGAVRVVPQLLLNMYHFGFVYTLCRNPTAGYGNQASGLWTMLFVLSKFIELGDTLLLVLAKKPVSFLHWFHHFTVLLYTWDAYMKTMPTGLYFAAMNYTVHAIMYFYYFLAYFSRPKWGLLVTILQITQMFIGIGISVASYQQYYAVDHCAVSRENLTAAAVMYACYLGLFLDFFRTRYLMPPKKRTKAE
jgi:hypothetical protein